MIPKVSIIVPIYNVEKYLKKCLDSLVNQTLSDIEIICVNDNTPDNSMDICRKFSESDERVKIVDKKNNEGLGLTRNAGVNIAMGEYIAFCDSDDYVDVTMYEKLYTFSKEHNLDACYCSFMTDVNGKLNYKNGSPKEKELYQGKNNCRKFLLEMIGPEPEYPSDVKYLISAWDVLYSTKIIKDYNVRFMCERKVLSEDTLFNIDFLIHTNNIGYIPDQLYRYRYNETSLSHTFNHKKAETFITLLNEVENRLTNSFDLEIYKLHYYRFVFYIFRLLIKYEAVCNIDGKRYKFIKERCKHQLLEKVFNEYPYNRMNLQRKFFIICMKKKWVWPLVQLSIIENKIKKNI